MRPLPRPLEHDEEDGEAPMEGFVPCACGVLGLFLAGWLAAYLVCGW